MIVLLVFICAAIPAFLFCWNCFLFQPPPVSSGSDPASVSVLIPARNEAQSIAHGVGCVLASEGVVFELIVLDDASTDNTMGIVQAIAEVDSRVRVQSAPALPHGWNGKQHACFVLAGLARYEIVCFLDADVRVAPDALSRMALSLRDSGTALVSGFPRQQTCTWLEKLLLPLIHFVLLGYLPFVGMRSFPTAVGFAAGCGQFMMARRGAYRGCGGHQAIRATMHDGLRLPRLFREHGLRTDVMDLTHLASCRLYRTTREVWDGLSKNATEGIAAPSRILPFTVLLGCGQVLPFCLLLGTSRAHEWQILAASVCLAYLPRVVAAIRFQQSWTSVLLHPIGVSMLLALEWTALSRKLVGRKAVWKDRSYDAG